MICFDRANRTDRSAHEGKIKQQLREL